jgi:glutaminyl-tRNA synthetase
VIDNYSHDHEELCEADNHPKRPELGKRSMPFSRELWIEREDFQIEPPKGYFRLYPGNEVRLRYAYVVKCTGFEKDTSGNVSVVHCDYFPESRSGSAGSEQKKVKGNIHWVSAAHAVDAEVRLYDRLFSVPSPGSGGRDFLQDLNAESKKVITARVEPALAQAQPEERLQFERHGYFVADQYDHSGSRPVFNRTVTMRDSWAKQSG